MFLVVDVVVVVFVVVRCCSRRYVVKHKIAKISRKQHQSLEFPIAKVLTNSL